MSRAKRSTKPRQTGKKESAPMLPESAQRTLHIAGIRLARACDVLNCLDVCARYDADLDLGALALAARDLIDKVLDDLAPLRRGLKTQGGES